MPLAALSEQHFRLAGHVVNVLSLQAHVIWRASIQWSLSQLVLSHSSKPWARYSSSLQGRSSLLPCRTAPSCSRRTSDLSEGAAAQRSGVCAQNGSGRTAASRQRLGGDSSLAAGWGRESGATHAALAAPAWLAHAAAARAHACRCCFTRRVVEGGRGRKRLMAAEIFAGDGGARSRRQEAGARDLPPEQKERFADSRGCRNRQMPPVPAPAPQPHHSEPLDYNAQSCWTSP